MVTGDTDSAQAGTKETRFSFRVDHDLKERVTALRSRWTHHPAESDLLREIIQAALPLVESGDLRLFREKEPPQQGRRHVPPRGRRAAV